MAGFGQKASERDGEYFKLLETVSRLPQCQVFKYGTDKGRTGRTRFEPVRMSSGLYSAGFYNRSYNRDEDLVNRLLEENPVPVSVLVSDGVYSDPQAGYSIPFVNAIGGWFKAGRVLAVYVFKASFEGNLYKQNDDILGRVNLDNRPFYAFVFSPNPQELEKFDNWLSQQKVKPLHRYVFSDSALSCPSDDLKLSSASNDDDAAGKSLYDWEHGGHFYRMMFDEQLFAKSDTAQISFGLPCHRSNEYPVDGLSYGLKLEAAWQWNGRRWEQGQDQGGFRNAKLDENQEISLSMARAPNGTHTLYQFALDLSGSKWRLKDEVEKLNSDNDNDPSEADRTYGFSRLMTGLIQAHFQQRLAARKDYPRIFITLQNQ